MTIKIEGIDVLIKKDEKFSKVGELFGKNLVMKRDPEKHIMRKFNAYGFSKDLIESDFFDHLTVLEPKNVMYVMSRVDLMAEGRYFKADNLERQIFVPLEYIKRHRV
jgi:hypothetical protein